MVVESPDSVPAQHLSQLGYLCVGLAAALPCVLLPLWLQPESEARKPLAQRHWVKANVWVAVFSFIGNYFWTHYFYTLLGAQYTFRTWRLNDVWRLHHSSCSSRSLLPQNHDGAFQSSRTLACCPGARLHEVTRACGVGASRTLLHDACILLLLPCAGKCMPAARVKCICGELRCEAAGLQHRRRHAVLFDSLHGDTDDCTLPLLQLQGKLLVVQLC